MSGHLFVVRGDVRKLRCDARMVPVYETREPNLRWFHEDERASGLHLHKAHDSWRRSGERVRLLGSAGTGPALWAAKVGLGSRTTLTEAMESVTQFMGKASAALDRDQLVSGRCKPLLVLHAVATGPKNSAARKGAAIIELFERVDQAVALHDVDVVIVAREDETYAALQCARSAHRDSVSPELDPTLRALARELASKARHGDLSVLVGAGLSVNAGLPSWEQLLSQAAMRLGLVGRGDSNLLTYASWIAKEKGLGDFRNAIAACCQAPRYALGHALFASAPVREFVTLNYDRLLEEAAAEAGASLTVIPHGRIAARDRWLLKLHGCVSRPEDIVITREDYEGFDEWRAAFRGVVETMLITRHMLFVGFGMADDNIDKVLETVAKASLRDEGKKGEEVGTVLMFEPAVPEKYAKGFPLRFVRVGTETAGIRERARQLEILLDEVARLAEDGTHHLLDQRFEHLLEEEKGARAMVVGFLTDLREKHPGSRVRREIMERLRPLMGGDPELTRLFDPPADKTPDGPLHPRR